MSTVCREQEEKMIEAVNPLGLQQNKQLLDKIRLLEQSLLETRNELQDSKKREVCRILLT